LGDARRYEATFGSNSSTCLTTKQLFRIVSLVSALMALEVASALTIVKSVCLCSVLSRPDSTLAILVESRLDSGVVT
jgi:hypothetical protein